MPPITAVAHLIVRALAGKPATLTPAGDAFLEYAHEAKLAWDRLAEKADPPPDFPYALGNSLSARCTPLDMTMLGPPQ